MISFIYIYAIKYLDKFFKNVTKQKYIDIKLYLF